MRVRLPVIACLRKTGQECLYFAENRESSSGKNQSSSIQDRVFFTRSDHYKCERLYQISGAFSPDGRAVRKWC